MNYPMTLEQFMSQGVLTEKRLVQMGADVASALAVIHQQMMVHGDIKPGNIEMRSDGSFRLMGGNEQRTLPLGMYQAFVAPEVQQGMAPTPASDIYSLGMMMRELVSRQGANIVLNQCIDKACAQEPQRRYARALDMAQELDTILDAIVEREYGVQNQEPPVQAMPPRMQQPPVQEPPRMQQPPMREVPPRMQQPPMREVPPRMQQPPMREVPPRMQQPTQAKAAHNKNKANQEAELKLRFLLPIMFTLIVLAAVITYFVLIRPELKDKDKTTEATTEMSASDTNLQNTAEPTQGDITIANYVNLELASVKSDLESQGLVVNVQYSSSDDVEANHIISQSVLQGGTMQPGQTITLIVSEGDGCPTEYHQKVTVTAASGSTTATLTVYNWENGNWTSKFSCSCRVGRNGIGSNYGEGKGVTPMGTFKLGYVLDTSNPGNGMKFKQVSSSTVVVDDVNSSLYNIICDSSEVPGGVSTDPIGSNITSGKLCGAIFIEHNGDGDTANGVVPGKASVITICGCNRAYAETPGCIDISSSDFSSLINALDGNLDPHIEISLN